MNFLLKILRQLLDLNSRKISKWISNNKKASAFCLSLLARQLKGKQEKLIEEEINFCVDFLIHFNYFKIEKEPLLTQQ